VNIKHEYQQFKPAGLPPTPADIEGPFYKAGAPESEHHTLVLGEPEHASGKLYLSGRVLATPGFTITGALLDVWQADKNGNYDMISFIFRGKVQTSYVGEYAIETIVPGDYQIADNPPDFRCAHIHFKVSADGFKPLTTQLYFKDDKFNATDHWFDPRRTVDHPVGTFDFVLEKA